jgi:hypothetical protein
LFGYSNQQLKGCIGIALLLLESQAVTAIPLIFCQQMNKSGTFSLQGQPSHVGERRIAAEHTANCAAHDELLGTAAAAVANHSCCRVGGDWSLAAPGYCLTPVDIATPAPRRFTNWCKFSPCSGLKLSTQLDPDLSI